MAILNLGMADGWVALAYAANILVTLFCIGYGLVCFNRDDAEPQAQHHTGEEER